MAGARMLIETFVFGKKVKLSLLQAVEARRVTRSQGSHITYTNG
jgi:hypothetical protein